MNGLSSQERNMTGLTSQRAAEAIGSRYDMVLVACTRVRELRRNHAAKIVANHSSTITALVEIEQGLVGIDYLQKRQPQSQDR